MKTKKQQKEYAALYRATHKEQARAYYLKKRRNKMHPWQCDGCGKRGIRTYWFNGVRYCSPCALETIEMSVRVIKN